MEKGTRIQVRICGTEQKALFTQRGSNALMGFIRRNGKTISGDIYKFYSTGEFIFFPQGSNRKAAYDGAEPMRMAS